MQHVAAGGISRPIKFILVGALNTSWSYVLFALFIFVGLNYFLASLLTIVLSVGFGFFTQGTLVFGGATREALPRFILVWALIYASYLLVVGAAEAIGINNYLGGLIATPVVAILSYVLQRRFVFSRT